MGRNAKANIVAAIVLSGFFISVAFHYVRGVYLRMPYPYNTFLFDPRDKFADFHVLLRWNSELNPYLRSTPTAQYPLLNLISYLLSTGSTNWTFELYQLLTAGALLWLGGVVLWKVDKSQAYLRAFILTFLTYPFLFTVDRGNFESLLCVFLLLFALSYQRGHVKLAAAFLACAIAMKLFPVVLLTLFISDRKYKAVLHAVAWTVLLTVVSTACFEGGFVRNMEVLLKGQNLAANPNVTSFTGPSPLVQRGVSLFSAAKILHFEFGLLHIPDMGAFLPIYALTMVALSLLVAVYVVLLEDRLWKKMTLLVFAMLVFPQISADYKLLHVLVPLLLFIDANTRSKLDIAFAIGFALLLVPKNYVLFERVYSEGGTYDISISMLMNPAIMMLMMLIIMYTGVRGASFEAIRSRVLDHWRVATGFLSRLAAGSTTLVHS